MKKQLALKYTSNKRKAKIVFIVEDSCAISDNDWVRIKLFVSAAVDNCSLPNVKFAIVTNNSKDSVLLTLTEKKEAVTQQLDNYARTKGTFVLTQCLKCALSLMRWDKAHTYIIILAGTSPDPQARSVINNLYRESCHIWNEKILITAALFNMNSKSGYEKICNIDSVFSASDSDKIMKIIDSQYEIHDYAVGFKVMALDVPVSLGEDLKLEITAYNKGKETIPPGMSMLLVGSSYFSPLRVFFHEALSEDMLVRRVTLLAKGEVSPAKLPTYLEFVLSHQSLKHKIYCQDNSISLYSDMFVKDILTPPCNPPLKEIPFFNILRFGIAGAGKSAFVNSLLTSLNEDVIAPFAVGVGAGHVTKYLSVFPVSTLPGYEKVPINFFDVWGLECYDYKEDMLLQVVRGELPVGYRMVQRVNYSEEVVEAKWTKFERRIHCVLFFMPSSVLDAPAIVSDICRYLSLCTSTLGLNPLIIVTRAAALGGPENEEKRRQELAIRFSVPAGHIFMIDNYTKEKEKDMAIDKKMLEILTIAMKSCRTYQMFYRDSLLKDIFH